MDYQYMATLLKVFASGANAHEFVVTGDGVLFVKEKPARIYAEKHSKDLIEIKEPASLGWLAKNRAGTTDDDDEIIAAIKKALADAGLLES